LVVVPVGMWAKAQPVGEADRPHIHGLSFPRIGGHLC
jgi:hypothetical protein